MALPGCLVSGLERDITRLCGSHAQGTQHTGLCEGRKPGAMVSTMDSHSRAVAQYEQAIRIRLFHQYRVFDLWDHTRLSGDRTCLDCSHFYRNQMPSQYVVVTDAGLRKFPPVCRKGPHRARKFRPPLLRHDGRFNVQRSRR